MAKTTAKRPAVKGGRRRKRPLSRRRAPPHARAIETLLASFAHDVRTPLTGILALSELLATSELGERERRWVAALKSSAEHLAALATLFIDGARVEAKGLVLRREAFDLRRMAKALSESLSARAQAKGLSAEATIADDLPEHLSGDAVRLRAAVENLLDNAVKFTDAGRVELKIAAQLMTDGRIRLVFAVSDSGIGMTAAEVKRLFRPYAQASATVAEKFGGAGLGLLLVKRLAVAMGGDLAVVSRPGRGSTFTLSVAVEPAVRPTSEEPTEGGERAPIPARALSILCVEDNPYGRVIMNTILSELGHRTDFVGTGEAALEAVARGEYDVVLMDVVLSGMDGLEATRRIRALPGAAACMPVIGISGHADKAAAARAAGMDGYLQKPISPRALTQTLNALPRRETNGPIV